MLWIGLGLGFGFGFASGPLWLTTGVLHNYLTSFWGYFFANSVNSFFCVVQSFFFFSFLLKTLRLGLRLRLRLMLGFRV